MLTYEMCVNVVFFASAAAIALPASGPRLFLARLQNKTVQKKKNKSAHTYSTCWNSFIYRVGDNRIPFMLHKYNEQHSINRVNIL